MRVKKDICQNRPPKIVCVCANNAVHAALFSTWVLADTSGAVSQYVGCIQIGKFNFIAVITLRLSLSRHRLLAQLAHFTLFLTHWQSVSRRSPHAAMQKRVFVVIRFQEMVFTRTMIFYSCHANAFSNSYPRQTFLFGLLNLSPWLRRRKFSNATQHCAAPYSKVFCWRWMYISNVAWINFIFLFKKR